MDRRQIERYFKVLARELDAEARVILTGAACGAFWGRIRPSVDVDFAIQLKRRSPALWRRVEEAVERTAQLTGIPANFAEDIDRWGMISLLNYRQQACFVARFGRLRLYLMDPVYWSLGKITRYLEPDIRDVAEVFHRQRVKPARALRVWGRALRASPRSAALFQFRRQAEDFLVRCGRSAWGRSFDSRRALRQFHRQAGINGRKINV